MGPVAVEKMAYLLAVHVVLTTPCESGQTCSCVGIYGINGCRGCAMPLSLSLPPSLPVSDNWALRQLGKSSFYSLYYSLVFYLMIEHISTTVYAVLEGVE